MFLGVPLLYVRLASETVSSWRVGRLPPSSAIALWVSGLANPPSISLKSTLLVRLMRIRTHAFAHAQYEVRMLMRMCMPA